jgi:nicotinate-nucleotide--dimethylbenzimidazole phosphoribosyltransferase
MGVASDLAPDSDLVIEKIALGTHDFSQGPAMTRDQAQRAVEAGIRVAMREMERGADTVATRDQGQRAVEAGIRVAAREMERGADMLATGDMGIGNTTASSAIVAALTGRPVAEVTGRGTGVDDAGLARKVAIIERALEVNRPDPLDGWDVLSKVGGFEIGGLAGVMLGAAAQRTPVVIDGFISGAAAMIACTLAPQAQPYLIAAHRSVEIGHRAMLEHLRLKPLFDLDLRLGEGTGAALGISLCLAACKVLDEMATFGEAGVTKNEERGAKSEEGRAKSEQ